MITPADGDAHPLYLYTYLMNRYGAEFWRWLPETRRSLMDKDFGLVEDLAYHKVEALATNINQSTMYFNWPVFEKISAAYNNSIPFPFTMQKPSVGDIYHTVIITRTIDLNAYNKDMARYFAAVLLTDGIVYAPPPLDFVQDILIEFQNSRNLPLDWLIVRDRYEYFMQNPGLEDLELELNPVDIQVGYLLAANMYVKDQLAVANAQLGAMA